MSLDKLNDVIQDRYGNYILPFFWQHGEDDNTLKDEINAIFSSGIRSLCVESRPHPDFCGESWWHTMDTILKECESLDMAVWLLDDAHFPSGWANGIIPKKYPELSAWGITERHMDVIGPQKDAAVLYKWKIDESDELVGIFACERAEKGEKLTGKVIDVTSGLNGDVVYFDLPEGCYRIVFIFKTRSGYFDYLRGYADKLSSASMDKFIEAVYQPHYEHYKEYFGKTFAGFFSDEPAFGLGQTKPGNPDENRKYLYLPWHNDIHTHLCERLGDRYFSMLPALWFGTTDSSMREIRYVYMDIITDLYRKNYCNKLGDWCREHGVEYIGHVVEDDQRHITTLYSAGHYFRSLDGQDMAGIDVVLDQIVPGMTDNVITVPCDYDVSDPDFFHFMLPKLGSSHAHIQPLKKGRAMCEIFGAYGWAEGLKMMKWLTDLMLVRGINYYVPHAFSPKFPDPDCPPHFYAHGKNPQFKNLNILMNYTNKICHILNGGVHFSSAAVLYHAEAAWCGGRYMETDKIARLLTENQLDYDIVSADYIENAVVADNRLKLSSEEYPCLIVPYSEYLPEKVMKSLKNLADNGLPIAFSDGYPIDSCEGNAGKDFYSLTEGCVEIPFDKIVSWITEQGFADTILQTRSNNERFLRIYHYAHGNTHYYFMTNEGIHNRVKSKISLSVGPVNKYLKYDIIEDAVSCCSSEDGMIAIDIAPYCSIMVIFGDIEFTHFAEEVKLNKFCEEDIVSEWSIYYSTEDEYPNFREYAVTNELFNMTGNGKLSDFSGNFKYVTSFGSNNVGTADKILLDLGYVGETATLYMNGKKIGTKIAPPYMFDVTEDFSGIENNEIVVEVSNHLGYKMKDNFSKYLLFEPSGLLGPVKLIGYNKVK